MYVFIGLHSPGDDFPQALENAIRNEVRKTSSLKRDANVSSSQTKNHQLRASSVNYQ